MKRTNYHYKKTMPAQGQRAIFEKPDETEAEWKDRLRDYGCTEDQINSFLQVTSLEAFVQYCIDQGLEEASIPADRLETNAA